MKQILVTILCCIGAGLLSANELPKKLRLGATQWCPYTCQNQSNQGAVSQYIKEILAPYNIEVEVVFSPWTRTIRQATTGELDGLLISAADSTRALNFTKVPIHYYQTCFFTLSDTQWQYRRPLALRGFSLGVVQDYRYGFELDVFLTTAHTQIMKISGGNVVERLTKLLEMNRVDVIAVDRRVFNMKNRVDNQAFREAGCLRKEPLYVGLNRSLVGQSALRGILNKEFDKPSNQRRLRQLLDQSLRK